MEITYITDRIVSKEEISGLPFNTATYDNDMVSLSECYIPGRGKLVAGENGIDLIVVNRAFEFFFIIRGGSVEAIVNNEAGIFAGFPMPPACFRFPVRGVLLDLDGTCVKSEKFWIKTILETTNELRQEHYLPAISGFGPEELPFISGRTVPEHLMYCIGKYCPGAALADMQKVYKRITEEYMLRFSEGLLDEGGFEPAEGLYELLTTLKTYGIRIGLVTSGLYYKAWPEIVQAMDTIGLGDPLRFFDAIITSGTLAGPGRSGTMGNAIAKPWPNIYFEAAQVMGFTMEDREYFIGIGDSAADAGSVRFMGSPFIGIEGGNIRQAGCTAMCNGIFTDLTQVVEFIKNNH